MQYLYAVPILFGKPINIWLGIVLLITILLQVMTGVLMKKGHYNLQKVHFPNAAIILIVVFFHAYYGLGVWFFGFKYGG